MADYQFDHEDDGGPAWERSTATGAAGGITGHRLFPAIVALWFAALLGLGMLVLPAATLESVSMALGLPAVFAPAAPSLGLTARILIALAAALGGGLAGFVLARQLRPNAGTAPARRRRARGDQLARRPISAREELGEERFDAPLPLPGRRRALSVSEDGGRSEFLDLAPLPGDGETDHRAPPVEPLELTALAEPAPAEHAVTETLPVNGAAIETPEAPAMSTPRPSEFAIQWAALRTEPAAPTGSPAEPAPFATPAGAGLPADEVASAPLAQLSVAQLVERFSLALESRPAPPAAPALREHLPFAQAPAPIPAPPAQPTAPAPFAAPAPLPEAFRTLENTLGSSADEADDADGQDLDTIFGLPLKREPRPFDRPSQATPAAPIESDDANAADDIYPSLLAMKSPFQPGREPVRIEDDAPVSPDAWDEAQSMVEFPRPAANPAPAPFAPPSEQRPPVTPATFAPPAGDSAPAAPVRPFDAPAPAGLRAAPSTAPAPDRPDISASERALRDALEKLNRMSGAA